MSKAKQEFTYEIIDPNSREQLEKLLKAVTVEKLLALHIERELN